MRKYINIVLGILLIVLAVWLVKVMGISKQKARKSSCENSKNSFRGRRSKMGPFLSPLLPMEI